MKRTIKRARRERGVTTVEAALAAPIFFFFIFLIFECALFARAYLATGQASANSARTSAVVSKDPQTDKQALDAAHASLRSVARSDVVKIVVYRASASNNYDVPAGCKTGSVAGWCNYYTGSDFDDSSSSFGGTNPSMKDFAWPPDSRFVDPLDRAGVYVEVKNQSIVKVLPQTIRRAYVADPEPS